MLDDYELEVEYLWYNHSETGVKLFKHWYKIYLQQEIMFQRDSYDNCVDDGDIVNCELTLEFFVKYCNDALINTIEEKYKTLNGF